MNSFCIQSGLFILGSLIFSLTLRGQSFTFSPLETVAMTNLLQEYQDNLFLSNNVLQIQEYLSGKKILAVRISLGTETSRSHMALANQTKKYGKPIYANYPHSHINFSQTQFLVEELVCSPNSYPLDIWDPVKASDKIRSDAFYDGKFYVLRPRGNLSFMEFGTFEDFKKACLEKMGQPAAPAYNDVLDRATIDFRQYLRVKNLGNENIIQDSFTFSTNEFTCKGLNGDSISGYIKTNNLGLVKEIHYGATSHYGQRTFLLFYESFFTNCNWYPSRILDIKESDGLYAVRIKYTIFNAYVENTDKLPIPESTTTLYGTNVVKTYMWSNAMPYELQDGQAIPRPSLIPKLLPIATTTLKRIFLAIILTTTVLPIGFWIYFCVSKKQKNKTKEKDKL